MATPARTLFGVCLFSACRIQQVNAIDYSDRTKSPKIASVLHNALQSVT
ncbi:hypothetical protein [Nostoc sp. CALU 1950]